MKRIFPLLLFAFFGLFASAQDTAVRGGFIEYRHLTNKVYEAKLTLYVACPYPGFTPVIECTAGGASIPGDTIIFVSNSDVSGYGNSCSTQTSCSGGSAVGVNKLVWTREFDLDTFSGCDVVFYVEGPKRDGTITTGWAHSPFLVYSSLNQCKAAGSSTPGIASTNASFLHIQNQDIVFNFGASSKGDFDSVSYELAPPMSHSGYIAGPGGNYSYTRPVCFFGFPNQNLQWPAGFHLDELGGEVLYRPTSATCFGPIVVQHKYWKLINGTMQLVGVLNREQSPQVLVPNGNKSPKIFPPYSKQFCAGQKTCITIETGDDDTTDTVTLDIEADIPGLDIQINNGQSQHATAQICWTPDSSQVSNVPYTFYMKATDNFCPLPGNTVRAFSFFVRETPKAQRSVQVGSCGRVIASASPMKSYTNLSYAWNIYNSSGIKSDSSYTWTDTFNLAPGTYYSEFRMYTQTPCFETYYDTIVVAPYNQSNLIADTLYCRNDSIHAAVQHTASEIFTYSWSREGDPNVLSTNSIFSYAADSSHRLVVKVKWGTYCEANDTQFVQVWQPKREIGNQIPLFCPGDSGYITIIQPSSDYTYLWNTQESSDSIQVKQAGWYSLQTTYFQGCVQIDSIEVNTHALPSISFVGADSICFGDSTLISAQVNGTGPFEFVWDNKALDSFRYSQAGTVSLVVKDGNRCLQLANHTIGTHLLPSIQLSAPDSICPGDSATSYAHVTGSTPFQFLWNNGSTDSFRYSIDGLVAVEVTDRNGCKQDQDHEIGLFSLPVPDDSVFIVCAGEAFRLFSQDSAGIKVYYSFGDSGNYLIPQQSAQGQVLVISPKSCPAIYPIDITVNEPHDPAFTYMETNPAEVDFTPAQQGNAYYDWDFGDNTSSASMFPTHTFTGNGPFTVTLWVTDSTTGCADSSSQVISFNVGLNGKIPQAGMAYPNPFENGFYLSNSLSGTYRVYSVSGVLVAEGRILADIRNHIDAGSWKPGFYILRLESEGSVYTEKLIRK